MELVLGYLFCWGNVEQSMELTRLFLGLLARLTEYGGTCPTIIFVVENSIVLIGQFELFPRYNSIVNITNTA